MAALPFQANANYGTWSIDLAQYSGIDFELLYGELNFCQKILLSFSNRQNGADLYKHFFILNNINNLIL